MGYKNGKDILPEELIRQIQQYIDGENIYIPRKEGEHKKWGEKTPTRKLLQERNDEIVQKYCKGVSVVYLSSEYHISTQGIYKIIKQQKQR